MIAEKNTAVPTPALADEAKKFAYGLLLEEKTRRNCAFGSEYFEKMQGAALALAEKAQLTKQEAALLEMAVVFYSAGRALSSEEEHLEKGKTLAREFFGMHDADPGLAAQVGQLLDSLEPGTVPSTFLEQLLHDATTSYLGQQKFRQEMKLLKMAEEARVNNNIDRLAWENEQLELLRSHVYYTKEAESLFGKQKQKNLEKANKVVKKYKKQRERDIKATSISANSGARTMFKTALRNHIDLTNIADQKANIMLSINALIITIGLPAFATYLTGTSYLLLPGIIFLLTSVATMIIATISTRPVKTDGHTDLNNLLSGKTNLFFFGNFYRIDQKEYQEAIKKIVAERDFLDTSFINDLYFLGKALGHKFRYLRLCYNVFIIGVLLSVGAFVIAYIRFSIQQ